MDTKNKAVFTMRIDKDEKQQLRELYGDMGLDLTTAVKMFFKQSLAKNGLPFQPTRADSVSAQARKEVEQGKLKSFDNVTDLMADLMNDED